jgi:hypothetical protein
MKFGYSVGDAVRDDKLHINYPDAMVEESERCAIRGSGQNNVDRRLNEN